MTLRCWLLGHRFPEACEHWGHEDRDACEHMGVVAAIRKMRSRCKWCGVPYMKVWP